MIVGFDPANALADCNCDNLTGITDAIALLRCLVGFDEWPITCGWVPGEDCVGPDGQVMLWVDGGSFMMGSDLNSYEQPIHNVTLDGFWIGRCEVSTTQYAAFLNATQPGNVEEWISISSGWCGVELHLGTYRARDGYADMPVDTLKWAGAAAYCEHFGYRLLTEAQWEYAAAGADTPIYPWGDEWDPANCCNWENRSELDREFDVGSIAADQSWCGAMDMAGNVYEWCADWYDANYYATSPEQNPPGPAEQVTDYRVVRGGAWVTGGPDEETPIEFDLHRCAARGYYEPGRTFFGAGFRVAKNVDDI